MKYYKKISLKDGRECCLRNATEKDGAAVLENFLLTHEQTDFLLSYPDENTKSRRQMMKYLRDAKTSISLRISR